MIKLFFSNKRNLFVFTGIVILICVLVFFIVFSKKKNYNAFIEFYLPNDSYGEVIYAPGNSYEFNLYVDSFLNIDVFFSDSKEHQYTYVIENENVVTIENDLLIAKKTGKTNIYIITDENVKSNVISLKVIDKEEKDE